MPTLPLLAVVVPKRPSTCAVTLALFVVSGLCASCRPAGEGDPESRSFPRPDAGELSIDERAAVEAAEALLTGITSGDTIALARVLLPESRLVAVSDDVSQSLRVSDAETFLKQIADPPVPFLERMWDPAVRVDGPIAMVWTPYDFHRGGEFSHCGIDAFHLVRRPDGWKVLSVIYTMHPEPECAPSPLGVPGA